MNIKNYNYMASIAAFGLAFASTAHAQAVKKVEVMELLDVQGKVLVERLDGSQYSAQKGAVLAHGSKMLMLNGSQVKAKYLQNKCEVIYKQNRVVNVRQDKQCSAGVAVINANQYAKFGNAANPGCCVIKTVTVPTAVTPSVGAGAAGAVAASTLFGGASAGTMAGVGLLSSAIANNNDDEMSPNNN